MEQVNLTQPFGFLYCVSGKSGSGKTTFLRLLLESMDKNGGMMQMSADGTQIAPQTIKNYLSDVPQEPSLFHTSIRKNLDMHQLFSDSDICLVTHRVKLLESCN